MSKQNSEQGNSAEIGHSEHAIREKRVYRKKASFADPTRGMGIDEKKLREVCSLHTKLVRNIVGLSRQELAEKINMSPQIVRVWEDVHAGRVSDKGARKLKEQLEEMGVCVDEQWLMYGTGCMPVITYKYYQNQGLDITLDEYRKLLSEDAVINQEIQVFQLNVKNAVVMTLKDNSCEPAYFAGDRLGGIVLTDPRQIKALETRYCLLKMPNGELVCRHLNSVNSDGSLDLVVSRGHEQEEQIQTRVNVSEVIQITRYWGKAV